MLRRIVSTASRTPLGKAAVVGIAATFLYGCGSSIGPIDVPNVPSINLPSPSLPSFGRSESRRDDTSGVFAAPGTDWGYVSAASTGYRGLVVSDEPRATLAARDVLLEGGNAADAVTALYFTLVATNPAAASLGGGGICLIHDERTAVAQSVDFLPRAPSGGGSVAIPGAVRGFARIHAAYGTLRWRDLVDPAAVIAAGHPMSRTLARRLDGADTQFIGSSQLRRTLTDSSGVFLDEGDRFVQSNLAGSIGIIASRGPQDLYTGELALRFIEEAEEVGGQITTIDMQSYQPNITTAQAVDLPGQIAFVPAGATGSGYFFPEMTQKSLSGLPQNPAPGTPGVSTIQTNAISVLNDSGINTALPSDFGSSAFAVTDNSGLTVACGVTENGAFGTRQVGRSSGIIYARSPSDMEYGLSSAFLTPLIATNTQGTQLRMAAVSSGGPNAAASLLYTAMNTSSLGLENALDLNGSRMTDTVNAISCVREGAESGRVCRIGVDPRGSGLGAEALR